ncbi:MAG TPA: ChbG/HpnK family deacetylase, partial [Chitinophagaceae bacterium]|nr:ChbG/HpnK family deacetylase [Chitinophagaceae bacterium]
MRKLLILFVAGISVLSVKAQSEKIPLLFRLDDIGMCHSVNMAAKEVLETRMPVSMSVMVPCPWFTEAVEILKQYPHVSVGIHLT